MLAQENLLVLKVINLVLKIIGKGKPIFGGLDYRKDTNKNNFPNIAKAKKIKLETQNTY